LSLCQERKVSALGGGHFLAGALGLIQLKQYQETQRYSSYEDIKLSFLSEVSCKGLGWDF